MTARRSSFVRRALLALVAPALLVLATAPASAQGKGHGNGHRNEHDGKGKAAAQASAPHGTAGDAHAARAKSVPPGHAKRHVTHDDAVSVSRQVLGEKGYVVSRVERKGNTRVIYYYRGNNGRGKGHGPLMHMVVRPTTVDRYSFDGAPKGLVPDMMARLRQRM